MRWTAGWLLVLLAGAGCATTRMEARRPDATAPKDESATVDFSGLFTQSFASASVYSEPKEPGLMKRVLLSPNVVFESSRSSLKEPKTVGPANPGPTTPDLPDALGRPIPIEVSSALLKYLTQKGSVVIAPVTSTLWDKSSCSGDKCPERTWVERMMAVFHAADKPSPDFPFAMLAVRQLGVGWRSVPVVATRDARGNPVMVPRHYEGEPSACPATSVDVPVVTFSAELVSIKDGHILARIEEERVPKISVSLSRPIALTHYVPQTQEAYTQYVNGYPDETTKYSYVSSYQPQYLACDNMVTAFRDVQSTVIQQIDVPAMVNELLASSLDQLYR